MIGDMVFYWFRVVAIMSWFTLDMYLEFGMVLVLLRPGCILVMVHVIS